MAPASIWACHNHAYMLRSHHTVLRLCLRAFTEFWGPGGANEVLTCTPVGQRLLQEWWSECEKLHSKTNIDDQFKKAQKKVLARQMASDKFFVDPASPNQLFYCPPGSKGRNWALVRSDIAAARRNNTRLPFEKIRRVICLDGAVFSLFSRFLRSLSIYIFLIFRSRFCVA